MSAMHGKRMPSKASQMHERNFSWWDNGEDFRVNLRSVHQLFGKLYDQ